MLLPNHRRRHKISILFIERGSFDNLYVVIKILVNLAPSQKIMFAAITLFILQMYLIQRDKQIVRWAANHHTLKHDLRWIPGDKVKDIFKEQPS